MTDRMYRLWSAAALCALALAVSIAAPGAVTAYDTGFMKGPLVARGETPGGVGWTIVAARPRDWSPRSFDFEFFFDPPGYPDAGFGIALPRPIPRGFLLTAVSGSDITPYPESDVAGVAMRKAASIDLRMDDGSTITFAPRKPPARVIERHPWTRRFRVFDECFPADLEPRLMKIYDRGGELLERRRSKRGIF